MEVMSIIMYSLEVLMVLIGLMILISKNPIHSVLYLVLLFCNGAGILMLLGVEFLSIIYVIIYVGAIAILFLFIVMMLNIKLIDIQKTKTYLPIGVFIGLMLLLEFYIIRSGSIGGGVNTMVIIGEESESLVSYYNYKWWLWELRSGSNIEVLGELLYVYRFVLIFLCGIVLLVAMIGAIILTMVEQTGIKKQDIYEQQVREVRIIKKVRE